MWGAAKHDRATGVHRPLTATALWLAARAGRSANIVLGLDHCILDAVETAAIRDRVAAAVGIAAADVQVCLSHTHGSAWMSRTRSHLPGGDLIGPYLDRLPDLCAEAARRAASEARPGTLVYGTGKCSLAAHRDYQDVDRNQFVCGFNPGGPADDTVLVAKALAETGETLGTVVNYACHPTTLAWENTLLSPDYVGAMREVVEAQTGGPCLFLQGASGDLGPRDGYTGDVRVADRNGRQLGFAALEALEALPPAGTRFEYTGPVVSGAILGTWAHRPMNAGETTQFEQWDGRTFTVDLPYRPDLPGEDATRADLARWETEEAKARAAGDPVRAAECRALAEQMTRQLARLAALPAGPAYPFRVTVRRFGGAVWVFTPGELYQVFQTTLRARSPAAAVVVATVTNDWQPGYIPTAATYGHGIYQEIIAAVAPGSLDLLIDVVGREIAGLAP
jgi:hypothetical protein